MASLADLIRKDLRDKQVSYISALDTYLTEKDPKPRRPGFHPSGIAWRFCPFEEALLGLGLLIGYKDISAQLQRIFDNGHGLHDRMQRYSRGMGVVVDHELLNNPKMDKYLTEADKQAGRKGFVQEGRVDHPVGITGNFDDLLELEEGYWDLVDYKSIKQESFNTLIQPVSYHEKQLIIYMGLLDFKFKGEVPKKLRGRMVYENKNNQELKEYIVPWNDVNKRLFKELIEFLKIVNKAVATDQPEIAPCICGKCDYDIDKLRTKPRRIKL